MGGGIIRRSRAGIGPHVFDRNADAVRVVHRVVRPTGGIVRGGPDEGYSAPPLIEEPERSEYFVVRGIRVAQCAQIERHEGLSVGVGLLPDIVGIHDPDMPRPEQSARGIVCPHEDIALLDAAVLRTYVE